MVLCLQCYSWLVLPLFRILFIHKLFESANYHFCILFFVIDDNVHNTIVEHCHYLEYYLNKN